MSEADSETLANFRDQLRRSLRNGGEATHAIGVRSLRYSPLFRIKCFQGREWATVAELDERMQAKHHAVVALVSRCEAAGGGQRRTSRSDQHRVGVHLTPLGEVHVEELDRLHRDEPRSVKSGFVVPGMTQPGEP